MADIRSYMKEKEKRENKKQGYKEKIVRHKLTTTYRLLLVVIAFGALLALVAVQYNRHIYTAYDIVSSVERDNVAGTMDLGLGSSIFSYSNDGAHSTAVNGEVSWNQTFQMQDVELAFCGDVVAMGDYNGRNIYVANSEQVLGGFTTTMPIRDLTVAANGRVTAVLADTDVTWINTYNSEGKLLYNGQAKMNDSGYPASISLSPNGELLCVSYTYIDVGELKTNIAFYNFGEVGDNYSDHLASIHIYNDLMVPYVQFMNDRTAFAVGDSRLMIYSGSQKPVSQGEYLFEREIRSVYYSEDYVGLVFLSDNEQGRYVMEVYDTAAQKVNSYYFDVDYTDIFFSRNNFVVYNETECLIMTMDGMEKYHGNFKETVRLMLPASGAYRYILVTGDSIETIQLK